MEKNRYHNMSEEKKQRLKNIKKIIVRQKSLNIIMNKKFLIVTVISIVIQIKQLFN